MILFDLRCGQGHRFEGWFRDGAAFDEQAVAAGITCPVCGDTAVRKALMAPAVVPGRGGGGRGESAAEARQGEREEAAPAGPPPAAAEGRAVHAQAAANAAQVLRQMRRYIERNFDHVGPRFAEEARRMHHGETEKRSIYGDATPEESRALREEGIEVAEIPWLPPHDG